MKRDMMWGVRMGLLFASLFCAYAVAIFATQGSKSFDRLGVSLPAVLVVYCVGGAVAGAVVGLLRPLAVSRWGAMAVGVLAAVPVSAAALVALEGSPSRWSKDDLMGIVLYAIVMGVVGGNWFWIRFVATKRAAPQVRPPG